MPIEEAYGFVQDLSGPVHGSALRDADLRGDRDDISINGTWRILVPDDADEIIRTGVDDFLAFMRDSMGETLSTETYDPATGPENDARAIVVKSAQETDKFERQAFTFRSASDWLAIEAGGSEGVLYGFFFLEKLFTERRAPYLRPMRISRRPVFARRILRSFHSPYYQSELDAEESCYSDNYLSRLAHHGYNGIWLHERLRRLASAGPFSEYGEGRRKRLERLNDLIARARRYGIGVFLYLNEPRAFPEASDFYSNHPDAKGHVNRQNIMEGEGPYAALCTSSEEVRQSLSEGVAELFRNAPELAGLWLVTMSEHLTHCWSRLKKLAGKAPSCPLCAKQDPSETFCPVCGDRRQAPACPRCADRDPSEVIAEVVNLIADAAHGVSPDAEVIAHTWSWDWVEEVPHRRIMEALGEDVIVMGDFERGQWVSHRKRRWFADEYMLSLPGPSDDFRKKRRAAQKLGRTVYAKVQIANTHELATVPYISVPYKLCEKFKSMRAEGVEGYVGCWIFGGYPSIMTELAGRYSWEPAPDSPDVYLRQLAAKLYGEGAVPDVITAWKKMSRAFGNYPFSLHLVYFGPMNYTCVYPFRLTGAGLPALFSSSVHEPIGDGLDWAKLGLETDDEATFIREQFEILVAGWREGLKDLARALENASPATKDQAQRDFGVAEATMLHLDSTAGIIRFLEARARLEAGEDREQAVAQMKAAMQAELSNRRRLLEIARADSRIGFHSEAGYWYRPESIEQAIAQLEKQLSEEIDRL